MKRLLTSLVLALAVTASCSAIDIEGPVRRVVGPYIDSMKREIKAEVKAEINLQKKQIKNEVRVEIRREIETVIQQVKEVIKRDVVKEIVKIKAEVKAATGKIAKVGSDIARKLEPKFNEIEARIASRL
ncbi:DUF2252 family protein [Candidatus Babeliales bacterium]|nr:DUF2252 family protein [Candidatus Babeliales bacterium]